MKTINGRHEIYGYGLLERLALDLQWSWNHSADKIWQMLDPDLWEFTHNPWVVLQTVSKEKLKAILADPTFHAVVEEMAVTRDMQERNPAWFQQKHPKSPLSCAAYFSMEFMLSEALPIYSGGLGNVAGDQLKAASDLGLPVIGIGLLYQQGYFRQIIDANGEQQELFPYNDPGQLPISPLRKPNGEWMRLEIKLPGWSVWLRTWEVQVGRCKLYLLDTNDAANYPAHRGITSELYGGHSELRLKQEMVLGIAGWRLLDELGIHPEVCHLNEGHAALAVLERANCLMKKTGQPFDVAFMAARAGNLFTTHTAVSEGFDSFAPELIEEYLGRYAKRELGISVEELLALGRRNPHNAREEFNMAYLAIRGSRYVNGVSQLHAEVSRRIFEPLFPRWAQDEVPVGHVTNGVHMPSWDSAMADELWTNVCGKCRWLGMTENLGEKIRTIPDAKLWKMRNESRQKLVEYARKLLSRQLFARGGSEKEIEYAKTLFDPFVLTLGFARRFAPYKRPNLLLHDPERLLQILSNPERPVQLLIAGKAHPADEEGKSLIHKWMEFIQRADARAHVIFLSDYDMLLTEHLVQGVDLWINTPRRPWEASGTSGMKALVNGTLNCSELDGWWAEAYSPEVGWAIGDGQEHNGDPVWDAREAYELYDLLDQQIIPAFYERNSSGMPEGWIARIRESMAQLTPRFSSTRSVSEYTTKYYLPAATCYLQRSADQAVLGAQLVHWQKKVMENWPKIRFHNVQIETRQDQHIFEVQIDLADLTPDDVRVELYSNGMASEKKEMVRQPKQIDRLTVYRLSVPAIRPALDFTPRIIPHHAGMMVPLELPLIRWQR
ncbi:MAG: starch phosphorylase [Parachlamydiales bacterium]|nr:starch phosphorylase [Parachlamydiales bacterium]